MDRHSSHTEIKLVKSEQCLGCAPCMLLIPGCRQDCLSHAYMTGMQVAAAAANNNNNNNNNGSGNKINNNNNNNNGGSAASNNNNNNNNSGSGR